MSSAPPATSGFQAALRLAWGRPDAVVLMASDRSSVIRSFWSIPLALPTVLVRMAMDVAATHSTVNIWHEAVSEALVFIVSWLAYIEATHRLAPLIGRGDRWGRFIVLWNWCNVIEGVLVLIGGVPGLMGAPPVIDQVSNLVMVGWALWLEWYATRLALGVGPLVAAWLVLVDQSIGIFLGSLAAIIAS